MAKLSHMEIVQRTRVYRIALLAKRIGNVSKLALAVGVPGVSYHRAKLRSKSSRRLGEDLARKTEEALGLALLWLDGVGYEDDPWGERERHFRPYRELPRGRSSGSSTSSI